ncbi:hypothetical protein [Paenibacillus sp. FSL H8-0034]|uniref:hypothetical protein n=1 Tax=Paenibacillus sp. FSL H8-0034 TaxID=2954671 RepID=UPI0030FAD9A0
MATSSEVYDAANQLDRIASRLQQEADAFNRKRSSIVSAVKDLGDMSVDNDWSKAYSSMRSLVSELNNAVQNARRYGDQLLSQEQAQRRQRA